MSELHASVRKDISIRGRSSRRRRRTAESGIDQAALDAKRDEELRAKVRIKLADQTLPDKPAAKLPEGPRIQGRASSEELQKLLNEKKRQARARLAQKLQYERAVDEKARAKLSGRSSELPQEPPQTGSNQTAEADLADLADPADAADAEDLTGRLVQEEAGHGTLQEDSALLSRKASQRVTNRSVIVRVGEHEAGGVSGSRRASGRAEQEIGAQAGPKKTRLVFKLAGVLLLLFGVLLCVRWIARGKAPTDLVTVEGQQELASETLEAVSALRTWSMSELKELAGGQAPETEADTARLVEESKVLTETAEKHAQQAPKYAPYKFTSSTADPSRTHASANTRPAGRNSSSSPSRASAAGRSSEPPLFKSASRDPRLDTVREAFAQANVYYALSDPRTASYEAVQKNIRLAMPLLERCLDECDKARKQGIRAAELDVLEQSASMRLYDCHKRTVLK